jgi:copper transport protein
LREVVNSMPPRRRLPRLARGWALPAAPRRRWRVLVQVPVVLALTLVAVALAASELDAHPLLRATRPADGAVLEQAPDALVLAFVGPIEVAPGDVGAAGADGRRVDRGRVQQPGGDRRLVRVPLGRGAGGASTAVWRVWSANSDQPAGSLVFTVNGAAVTVNGAAVAGGPAATLLAVARFILLGALLVLVGGLGFLLLIWPDGLGALRVQRLIAGAWTAAVTAPLAGVRLHAVATWGVPPAVRTFIRQP